MKLLKQLSLTFSIVFISFVAAAQGVQQYNVNLNNIQDNTLKVELKVNLETYKNFKDTATFQFPKTIPGTYAVLDYGRFIFNLKAYDVNNKELVVKKEGENVFKIAGKPQRMEYIVKDTYHTKVKKNKIFEPAGTNIQKDKNIIFNNSGFFGIFRGTENVGIELIIEKSPSLFAITSLSASSTETKQIFKAQDYHELVDNPIMFSEPDTTSFMVANCKVTIGVYNESGRKISKDLYKEIETSMQALGAFFNNELPVNNYSFIIYLRDYTEFLPILEGKENGFFDFVKIIRSLAGQGFGALEHGNSSLYFLPDFGNDLAIKTVKDIASHEFLHILTPLNLHSEHVGNFDYTNPKMSKHLWLYEGITEYFAGLVLTQDKVTDPWKYIHSVLYGKITGAEKYPYSKMSFTEMSENVFNEPYKSEYNQVYERGALLGALLDIEIISATQGEKTLKDVVMSLGKKYGKNKSFSEEEFFKEFVAASHPSIQAFIDKYIAGKEELPLSEIFAKVGIDYKKEYKGKVPASPYEGIKFKKITLSNKKTIKKVSKKKYADFRKGDQVEVAAIKRFGANEYGFLAEGEQYAIEVEREGKKVKVQVSNRLVEGTQKNYLFMMKNPSEEQERNYKKWLKL